MIKNNYHTHVAYCNHAEGNVEDYVLQAIEFGFNEIGFTDHAPILKRFMNKKEYEENWCDENMKKGIVKKYLKDIKNAQKKYGDKIKIYSGFETEFIPSEYLFYKKLRDNVDYLNLGIHYYPYEGKILNTYSDVNYKNLHAYVDNAILGIKTGLYNVLVHPDLFMYDYKNINGERKFDEEAIKATKRICEAAIEYNVYLEINANGLKNSAKHSKNGEWLYPYPEFWNIAKEYKNLKIIIGADAHNPSHLANEYVEMACKFALDLGLNIEEVMEINH